MPPLIGAAAAAVAVAGWLLSSYLGTTTFRADACARLETILATNIVGQELATTQLVDLVCAHLHRHQQQHAAGKQPQASASAAHLPAQQAARPLILSVHGPPGVGKTFSHILMARALYSPHPEHGSRCPGEDCQGAKVIYGLDFRHMDRHAQLEAVRSELLSHCRSVKDPLVVIEEYDKLDCHARAMLRQLLEHAYDGDGSTGGLSRAIFVLESNLGFTTLVELLTLAGGDRSKITMEAAGDALKAELFTTWQSQLAPQPPVASAHGSGSTPAAGVEGAAGQAAIATFAPGGCHETWSDLVKFTSMVSAYLPFLPLQRPQIVALMERGLAVLQQQLGSSKGIQLVWAPSVVQFLVGKVDFDGGFPLEGGKQVETVLDRYLARALRKCPSSSEIHKRAVQCMKDLQDCKANASPPGEQCRASPLQGARHEAEPVLSRAGCILELRLGVLAGQLHATYPACNSGCAQA